MELTVIVTSSLCVCLLMLQLAPYAATAAPQIDRLEQHSSDNKQGSPTVLPPVPSLPRKLKLFEEVAVVKVHGGQGPASYNARNKGDISGKPEQKGQGTVMQRKGGTRQEWAEEGADSSQFFTMDYTNVKRRPPIHNKSLPIGP